MKTRRPRVPLMVHFHADVVGTYLADKHRILKSGDCALFHHSNYTENPERSCGPNAHAHVYRLVMDEGVVGV